MSVRRYVGPWYFSNCWSQDRAMLRISCHCWSQKGKTTLYFLRVNFKGAIRCAGSFETDLSPREAKWHNIALGKWESGWGNAAFCWGNKSICWGNEANLLGKWSKWMGKWSKMFWGDAPKVKWSIPVLPYIGTLCDSPFKRYKWLTKIFCLWNMWKGIHSSFKPGKHIVTTVGRNH